MENKSTIWGVIGLIISILGLFTVLFIKATFVQPLLGGVLCFIGLFDKKRLKHGVAIAGCIVSFVAILLSAFMIEVKQIRANNAASNTNAVVTQDEVQTESDQTETTRIDTLSYDQVLYDDNGLLIKFTGIGIVNSWIKLKIYTENNSSFDGSIFPHTLAVDGIMLAYIDIFPEMYTVGAGKKSNTEILIDSGVLEKYGIEKLKNVSIVFSSDFFEGSIVVSLDLPTDDNTKSVYYGEHLAEHNGVYVDYAWSNNDKYAFVVNNTTSNDIQIAITDTYINDYAYEELVVYSWYVIKGCQQPYVFEVSPEYKNANSISEVEKIESIVTVSEIGTGNSIPLKIEKRFP